MVRRYINDIFWIIRYEEEVNKIFLFLPIFFIIIISIFLFIFLLQNKDPSKPPSALLNENLPELRLISLKDEKEILYNKDLEGKKILINFFASWCAPCIIEHPLLFQIKKNYPDLYLLGINHKDKMEDAIKYIDQDGNPYDYIGIDNDGLVALDFGVFGLPETFMINSKGKIIYKYLGPMTNEIIKNEIYPLLK